MSSQQHCQIRHAPLSNWSYPCHTGHAPCQIGHSSQSNRRLKAKSLVWSQAMEFAGKSSMFSCEKIMSAVETDTYMSCMSVFYNLLYIIYCVNQAYYGAIIIKINQSINQSINQLINQSINQSSFWSNKDNNSSCN